MKPGTLLRLKYDRGWYVGTTPDYDYPTDHEKIILEGTIVELISIYGSQICVYIPTLDMYVRDISIQSFEIIKRV